MGVNDAQALLIAREVAASAGVEQKGPAESFAFTALRARNHCHAGTLISEFGDGPPLADFRARGGSMAEQEMIEGGALHLEGLGFASEAPVAKNQFDELAGITQMKLRSLFHRETGCLERGQNPHLTKDRMIIWEQGLADMEARKVVFFQDQDTLPGAGEEGGGGAATRSSANQDGVVGLPKHISYESIS